MWIPALALPLALVLAVILYFRTAPRIGDDPAGVRLQRIRALPDFRGGKLHNLEPTDMDMPFTVMLKVMWTMVKGADGREPKASLPTVRFDREAWERVPSNEVALCWFGHSCVLIKLNGLTFLTDPVFGERASTFSFAGPKRFAYTERISVDQLPSVDVLLLSHDHYDHLCYETMRQLIAVKKVGRVVAALGVGAHLEKWGMPAVMVAECAWWEQVIVGPVKLTFAPTRHFTGRGPTNRFSTLWGSFVLEGAQRIYFGGDSGYSRTFKELGARFGRFDLALLECGAYSEYWPQIHMFPEEVAQAVRDLNARLLMPIHWAQFALGLHPWKESIERITKRAGQTGQALLTPRIGRTITAPTASQSERWWEGLD
ncbi:MAG: MBL fold metallo-hydrolase [Flavobacteriales bacterium]|nr:MBL fold metallo-hydrolase [Flavobacteriales bacterium]